MAQFLGDGYDECGAVGGIQFEFRPLPPQDRCALGRRLQRLDREPRRIVAEEVINERLIGAVMPPSLTEKQVAELFRLVTGIGTQDRQREDEHNLRRGVRLLTIAPWTMRVSCEECRQWAFDPTTGRFTEDLVFGGRIPQGGPVMCEGSQSCPVGHYTRQRRLSEKNVACLRHYLRCQAVGSFPDDPYVRHNAHVIQWAVEQARKDQCRSRTPSRN